MATTIHSTELDFFEIKESLKSHFKKQEEFQDYDFEGSALSNLLDVMAHNTHFNALLSNFALNESYLTTAQLRNSIVTLAESLGYIPSSKTSASSTVSISVNLANEPNLEQRYTILPGELRLRGTIDDESYFFTNRKTIVAENNGSGIYNFINFDDPDSPITIREGEERNIEFLVDGSDNAVYVIPDEDIDTSTAIVKLYDNQSTARLVETSGSGRYDLYTSVFESTTINELSQLYVLRESPNRYYELTFGSHGSLGKTPEAGNVIKLNYLRSSGIGANGVASYRPQGTLKFGDLEVTDRINVVTLTRSSGGDEREDEESIRKRAPFQYAAQNRMITPLDYEALILRKYSNYIDDIVCWGGEDDNRRDYGAVYVSVVWKENLSSTTIGQLREEIQSISKDLSVVSFNLKFIPASDTWISTDVYYQYNPVFTDKTESKLNSQVSKVVESYFGNNIGKFQQVFRRSNLLTNIDDCDPAILSSRSDVKMQKRFTPILTIPESYDLEFPTALQAPTDATVPVITSTFFSHEGKTCFIRNKLTDRVKVSPEGRVPIVFDRLPSNKLEIVDVDGNVIVSNIGSYDPDKGVVSIQALRIDSVLSNSNYVKVFGIPANQSAIASKFSNILQYDDNESNVKAVVVQSRV